MKNLLFPLLLACALMFSAGRAASAPPPPSGPSADTFRALRYGLFVHNVYRLTAAPEGEKYATLNEFTALFDPPAFADQMAAIGVDYVIFTAWHKAMYLLGPSAAMDKWLPGHASSRDLLGEVIDALAAKKIQVIIYAHPNDGHDLSAAEMEKVGYTRFDKANPRPMPLFNDFLNEVYAEMVARYRDRPNVLGFWWDSWGGNGGCVDMPRLRETVRTGLPNAITLSQRVKAPFIDFVSHEVYYKFPNDSTDHLPVNSANHTFPLLIDAGGQGWWTATQKAKVPVTPESLFRFIVYNAGTGAPGGVALDASPLADGKTWSRDNQPLHVLTRVAELLRPYRGALLNVAPSRNWLLPTKTLIGQAPPFAATRSLDGSTEYLHVLRPPSGRTLIVPKPKEAFASAFLFANGHPVTLAETPEGLSLTLGSGDGWDPLNTVIGLRVAR